MSLWAGEEDLSSTSSPENYKNFNCVNHCYPQSSNLLLSSCIIHYPSSLTHCKSSIGDSNGGVVTNPRETSTVVRETHAGIWMLLWETQNIIVRNSRYWFKCLYWENLTVRFYIFWWSSTFIMVIYNILKLYSLWKPVNPSSSGGRVAELCHQLTKGHPGQQTHVTNMEETRNRSYLD